MTRLTEAQKRTAEDLANHATAKMNRAFDDVARLCSDRRQRGSIALRMLAGCVGLACAEIDKAEGRKVKDGEVSPEAYALVMHVFSGLDPAGRARLREEEAGSPDIPEQDSDRRGAS